MMDQELGTRINVKIIWIVNSMLDHYKDVDTFEDDDRIVNLIMDQILNWNHIQLIRWWIKNDGCGLI